MLKASISLTKGLFEGIGFAKLSLDGYGLG